MRPRSSRRRDLAATAQQFRALVATPYSYDVRLRLTAIGDALTDTYPFSANYTYSNAGLITDWRQKQKGQNPFCQVFTYDAGARLAGADFQVASTTAGACTQTAGWDLSGLSYDANGNLTALTRKSSTGSLLDALAYTYAAGTNRLASVGDGGDQNAGATPHAYSYDLDGAVVGDFQQISSQVGYHEVTLGMTLDRRKLPVSLLAERMTFAGDASGDYSLTASYRYAASGERYWKNVDGATEYYLLTGSATGRSQQVGVFTGTSGNALRHWNILTPSGEAIGRIPSTGLRQYYAKDHLGSTRAVVNESNAIVERHDYDAYGMELAGRGLVGTPVLNERYTGHQWDAETGLLYAGARLLDPAIGRWLSVDPLAGDFPAWAPYNYVMGNPVSKNDLDGKCFPNCLLQLAKVYSMVRANMATTGSNMNQAAAHLRQDPAARARIAEHFRRSNSSVSVTMTLGGQMAAGPVTLHGGPEVVTSINGNGDRKTRVGYRAGVSASAGIVNANADVLNLPNVISTLGSGNADLSGTSGVSANILGNGVEAAVDWDESGGISGGHVSVDDGATLEGGVGPLTVAIRATNDYVTEGIKGLRELGRSFVKSIAKENEQIQNL